MARIARHMHGQVRPLDRVCACIAGLPIIRAVWQCDVHAWFACMVHGARAWCMVCRERAQIKHSTHDGAEDCMDNWVTHAG